MKVSRIGQNSQIHACTLWHSDLPTVNINGLARRPVLSPIYKWKENEVGSSSFAATEIRNPRAQNAICDLILPTNAPVRLSAGTLCDRGGIEIANGVERENNTSAI
jgi:hypothetical protein